MKIDISQVKNTAIARKSDIKIKELNTLDINKLNASINSNSFSFKTNKEQDYNVFFRLDKDNIGVKLSENNINRLKDFFDEDNFIDTNKGIILDKDAASYVVGWFADTAYTRNYLAADKDNDGEITALEAWNLFDLVNVNYELLQDKNKEYFLKATNIDETYDSNRIAHSIEGKSDLSEALDIIIDMDKDLDGKVTAGEYWNVEDKDYINEFGIVYDDENHSFMSIPHKKIKFNIAEEELKRVKEQIKLNNIIAKLKKSQSLDNNEKEILQKFNIQNISNELKISEDKLKELITNDKLSDFIDFTKEFKKDLNDTKLIDIKV
ncbi:hypothetical protein [Campylobacter sp. RM12637]|uniref:hypothetical protein n=1 Tax=Campylobacter sp. RM12637 TaxID=2735734 RepID=UPI003014CFE0|nr:hypothetical protein [Campylobacter sp. RM12637]